MTPAELSRQVRLLEITTRHLVTEVFSGEYSSAFKGRGIEFAEVREYQPGDDIRSIDWNVTARTGRPFVKRFSEERELTILLCVDLSASGDFGTGQKTKQQLAAEVSSVIAFAATRNNDRVGLLIFTDRIELYVPPAKGSRHALRLIRELLAFSPKGRGTDFRVAADHISHVLKRRAVVFIASDFLAPDPVGPWRVVASKHDAVALHVSDPREHEMPSVGLVNVQDPETGDTRTIDTSSATVRRDYHLAAVRAYDQLTFDIRAMGMDFVQLATWRPYIHDLIEFFRIRERRR